MRVQEIRLQQVLEGAKQYHVPLYQRTYSWSPKQHSWSPKQLSRLWSDIVDLSDPREQDPRASHFTGSLVLSTGGMRTRDELRNRPNRARGVAIEDSKLKVRPTFSVDVLADVNDRQRVIDVLEWFTEVIASLIA